MRRSLTNFAAALLLATSAAGTAAAEKSGGILRIPFVTSPASMSIHEESTIAALGPMMGVFNNLVMFDQHVPQNSLSSIVPDLAESWTYAEDGKSLTFKLRQGVKWHDGKPFTAKDVKCTWELIAGNAPDRLRVNPRKSWYRNLDSVTVDNDHQVTFNLKRPQPSFIALLASGWSPVYPCHVTPAQMRRAPIGTGPFKFVEFKPNDSIKIVRNKDYWKMDRPYLDAIEYTYMANESTAILAFAAGNFDRFAQGILSLPLMRQLKAQAPNAVCEIVSWNIPRQLLVNPSKPPFDNPELRRAVGLAIDTAQWYPTVMRKDYTIGVTVSENGLDDPDQQFYENFVCGSERNYTGYCNPELDRLVDQQSSEADIEKRRQIVWEIERRLAE